VSPRRGPRAPRGRGATSFDGHLGFAQVDHERARRCGFPEVILGRGKTPAQVAAIFAELARKGDRVLATRTTAEAFAQVRARVPGARWHESAAAITWRRRGARRPGRAGRVVIAAAGTADLPVAEEARVTAEAMGARVEAHYDVGVAGIHRLFRVVDRLRKAAVVIVVAGMEGALPSVVGGLVSAPVIAVPTSIGYGASFRGVAALLGMLNSCAAGVSVVNIDNGFGAGYIAALIARRPRRSRT
jgi:NCAIR mutase (PurE)-related protein